MTKHQVELARQMMPFMPKVVFDAFLGKLIEEGVEWPFHAPDGPPMCSDWYRILYPFSLASLGRLTWERRSVCLGVESLFPGSKDDIELLRRNLRTNEIGLLGRDPEPYKQQVLRNYNFILENDELPSEPILGVTECGLKVFDGNHRIAAIYELGLESSMEFAAWVGQKT